MDNTSPPLSRPLHVIIQDADAVLALTKIIWGLHTAILIHATLPGMTSREFKALVQGEPVQDMIRAITACIETTQQAISVIPDTPPT